MQPKMQVSFPMKIEPQSNIKQKQSFRGQHYDQCVSSDYFMK